MRLGILPILLILAFINRSIQQIDKYGSLTLEEIINDAISEAYSLSRREVDSQYKVYLTGANLV